MHLTEADVRRTIRALGLGNGTICLHSSLRSFGYLQGGAPALVRAFLEEGCTLLVPTFSDEAFAVAPPPHLQLANNGSDYLQPTSRPERTKGVYTPESVVLNDDMGAVPRAVLALSEHVRGDHPLNSFTAVGPRASDLIRGQHAEHVYAPLDRLAELGGSVVLAGVGLTRMTLLHLAEGRAGRTLFRRWALDPAGKVIGAEVGSCSEGFEKFAAVLEPLRRQVRVGDSVWQVFRAADVLSVAAEAIRAEPMITHCGDPACERCRDAVLGGPQL